ncbi:uncharacterized protein LOC124200850 isoform X3 [Daphnia pulex]|uniref:uncharacterized protein LOC124200850 isoform X3 n=1 Tax=Daphnia pulex TaxID=6669 RepID=UPI001EDFB5EC|nr:uncharacterized protein LOC124200850 isoform X3 [Daphnia pulex]
MSSDVQIKDEDQQPVLKCRKPSSSNGFFTFIKHGGKIEEGIEHNHSLGEMGRSVCNVAGCSFTVEGKETRSLVNHLKTHRKEYVQFLSKCKEKVVKVRAVPHNVNTVETTIKDPPTVKEKIVASPVFQINGAASLPSPNLTVDNCDNKLPVLQENVERGSPQRQCLSELPLNSPLTMSVFLPLGTTLIVSDPSTLKIVCANSSQNLPPKAKNSPVTVVVENEPLGNTSASCATPSLLKCSQPTANRNSPVDNGALAMKGMAADNVNHTRSPPGSFNLVQPYSCSPTTVPIEHIRLQAIPTPGIGPSPSTETTHVYKTNPVTASIPIVHEVKIVSLSHQTTSFSSTVHPSEVIEQTKAVVKNSSSAQPSEQKCISQSSTVLSTETLDASITGSEPLEAVHEHLKVTASKKQPSVLQQPQQPSIRSLEQHPDLLSVNQLDTTKMSPLQVDNTENSSLLIEKSARTNDSQAGLLSKDVPLTAVSEMTELLEPNSHEECAATSPLNSFKKSLSMATGITVASFAKIGDGSEERAQTALTSMPPPLESSVPVKEPLVAASTSHSEDSPNSNKSAVNSPTIPHAEPSPITELDVLHDGSVSGTTNVCDKSSGETVDERTHPVFQFFKFNSVHGKSECIVDGCGVLRNGKNPATLINHLRVKHPKKAYTEFMAKWTTNWARPKRTTTMVNVSNIAQPSKILQSARARKSKKKNSPLLGEKGIELVPSSVIVPDLVSTGSVAPQGSSDGGPISNENPSVGSNMHQAILTDGDNSATHSYRKDSFNEKLHPVYRYFTFREATEGPAEVTQDSCVKSQCNFQGCNFTIKGNKMANLMLHLSLQHRDTKEFAEFVSLNDKYEAQRLKSMDNPSDRIQPRKRPLAKIAGNTYQEYLACRKKQRKDLGVGTAMSSSLISSNVANEAAAQLPVHTPEQELDFIGPDIPFEYSSLRTTVRDQPLLDSTFPN